MGTKFVRVVLLLSLLVMTAGVGVFVQAQDSTTGGVTCDSDLILSLYVAQRYLGFNDVRSSVTSTTPMADLNTFNYGQFQPLFDNMNNMSSTGPVAEATADASGMTTNYIEPGESWNDQWAQGVTSSLSQDNATFDQSYLGGTFPAGTDTSTITQLPASSVAGEAVECGQLRSELNRFYRALALQDVSSSMMLSQG